MHRLTLEVLAALDRGEKAETDAAAPGYDRNAVPSGEPPRQAVVSEEAVHT